MEDAEATVIESKLVHPLSLTFWYCSHLDSRTYNGRVGTDR